MKILKQKIRCRGPPGPPGPKGECEIIQVNNASNKVCFQKTNS